MKTITIIIIIMKILIIIMKILMKITTNNYQILLLNLIPLMLLREIEETLEGDHLQLIILVKYVVVKRSRNRIILSYYKN
jgi:hypothetical protein